VALEYAGAFTVTLGAVVSPELQAAAPGGSTHRRTPFERTLSARSAFSV
jgi:hypothetical protein